MLIGRLRSIANSEITGHPVDASGASDLHRTGDANEVRGGVGSVRFSSRFRSQWDRDRDRNRKAHLRTRGALWGVRSLDLNRTAMNTRGSKSTIVARSNRNRGAIEPRSWLLHRGIHATIIRRHSFENRDHDWLTIVARSWRDRDSD